MAVRRGSRRSMTRAMLISLLILAGTLSGGPAPSASASASTSANAAYRLSRTRLPDGRQVVLRWNPCQTITYAVNVSALPPGSRAAALAEVRTAVGRLSARTGLRFRYRGRTTQVPRSSRLATQSAELVVAFTSPSRTDFPIGGSTIGYGGRLWYWWSMPAGGRTVYGAAIVRGFVVLDAAGFARLRAGFGPGANRGNVLLHELGHAVGLDHTALRSTLMYPQLRAGGPNGYAAGDRAGLARVGRRAGCIAVPPTLPARDLG